MVNSVHISHTISLTPNLQETLMKRMAAIAGLTAVSLVIGVFTAALAQTVKMQPGLWEDVATTTAVEIPGAPAAAVKMMSGKTTTIRHCLTEAEAEQGPQAAMKKNSSCAITFHMEASGRFSSTMSCKDAGGTMTMASSGTASRVAFTSTSKITRAGIQIHGGMGFAAECDAHLFLKRAP